MFKRILVPVDGSETCNKALVAALQLARERDARVRVVHVLDELAYLNGDDYALAALGQARDAGQKVVDDALAVCASAGVAADGKVVETAGRGLGAVVAEEATRFEADLVAVGTHGRRGITRALLGSGAEQVLRLAPVPVLAFRTPPAAEAKP